MKINPVVAVVLMATTAVAIGAGGTLALSGQEPSAAPKPPNPASAAKTSFPGLAAATGEPDLAGLDTARPHPGRVVRVSGPFDDRFVMKNLAFDRSSVSGVVRITSDVSHVLELQVLAGFYDSKGRLLATNRFVHHLTEEDLEEAGRPNEREEFTIKVPSRLHGRAVAAAVGVPILVNE